MGGLSIFVCNRVSEGVAQGCGFQEEAHFIPKQKIIGLDKIPFSRLNLP